MSIRALLTFWFTAMFGAIVIALALSAYVVVRKQAYSELDMALRVAAGAAAMSAEHELNEHTDRVGGEKDLQSVLDDAASPDLASTQILVRENDRNVAYKPGLSGVDLRNVPSSLLIDGANQRGLRIAVRELQVPKFNARYEIYAAESVASAMARMIRLKRLLLIFVSLGFALAGVGGYLLAARSLRPLEEFARVVDTVSSSDLTARVATRNAGDEIGRLALRFNALLERLQNAFTSQRNFMADASHQIRTPLTIALAATQVTARDAVASPLDCRETLFTVEQQLLQLRRIVDDMFFLSQSDLAPLKVECREMFLDDAVGAAARAAAALSRGKGQTLKTVSLPEAKCLGDSDLLKQAVIILLDNAVKFTPSGGAVTIELFRRGADWACSITDTGIGIPPEDQPRIFERFFQGGVEAHAQRSGAGLGLAIAKSIVESHRGTLLLVASRPGCTVFEISIPAIDEEAAEPSHANSSAVRI